LGGFRRGGGFFGCSEQNKEKHQKHKLCERKYIKNLGGQGGKKRGGTQKTEQSKGCTLGGTESIFPHTTTRLIVWNETSKKRCLGVGWGGGEGDIEGRMKRTRVTLATLTQKVLSLK